MENIPNILDNADIHKEENWEDISVFSDDCIFCNRKFRKRNRSLQTTIRAKTVTKMNRICEILQIENSTQKHQDIEGSASITYHQSCLAEREHKLFHKSRSTLGMKAPSIWLARKELHDESFARVNEFVEKNIIKEKRVHNLAEIYDLYSSVFQEVNVERRLNLVETVYARHHLLRKILKSCPELDRTVFKNRTYLHRKDLSIAELFEIGFTSENETLSKIRSIAFEIRRKIIDVEKRNLPKHNISAKNIIEGECDIPNELYVLIRSLLTGPKDSANERKEIKIKSICSSIIFSSTNGTLRPKSCLSLGLVAKSLTGSRRVVEILNRLGHSVSYTVVEQLETELAYGNAAAKRILPNGLIANIPNLRTHVAFDNYDRYVETINGKDTLHDTVGIVYQNKTDSADLEILSISQHDRVGDGIAHDNGPSRRKYCSTFDSTIETYVKIAQAWPPLIGSRDDIPESLGLSVDFNHLWMFTHALNVGSLFRWSAWNSQRIVDSNPQQAIGYLPTINHSPTSDAVVCKTLKTALSIAEECGQKYIIVTYDLAIACKAYRIQVEMAPVFDRVFITLGAFHIQLSFFKVSNLSFSISNETH